jgi:hypothetical protein
MVLVSAHGCDRNFSREGHEATTCTTTADTDPLDISVNEKPAPFTLCALLPSPAGPCPEGYEDRRELIEGCDVTDKPLSAVVLCCPVPPK